MSSSVQPRNQAPEILKQFRGRLDAPSPVSRETRYYVPLSEAIYRGTYFPNFAFQPLFAGEDVAIPGIETPFTLYRGYYAGECVSGEEGTRYLEIRERPELDDQRRPRSIRNGTLESMGLGLHLLDYNFPMEDLLHLVAKQADAMA